MPDHGLARFVGLVPRFADRRLPRSRDVRIGVDVQMVVVDDFRFAFGVVTLGPFAGAEDGKPSAFGPSGERIVAARASVPTPMVSV